MRFVDTRGLDTSLPEFCDAVVKGITSSGGLFVPESFPALTIDDIDELATLPYWKRAAWLYAQFDIDLDITTIEELMKDAYGAQWDTAAIAPIHSLDESTHVLELWHGPTSAFKDMALQCMPRFFSAAIAKKQREGSLEHDILILVATSGDTGKAALEGFADRPHTSIVVFYPIDGVSDIQKKQMATQHGQNVAVYGVRGNFDDCQTAVKNAFSDPDFVSWLSVTAGYQLSSANSINWGRLMPQIVYYLSACADLRASGKLSDGQLLDICVPTGNFGNILGAYYAKKMGAPLGMLYCASNENRILSDFISTGTYDISDRPFFVTPSPSMDILISSNLERLLFDIAGPTATNEWMAQLRSEGKFSVDKQTFATIREHFGADYVCNDDSLETIRDTWNDFDYLCDPHTAVGLEVAARLRSENPVLVVSTAHWAKFAPDVLRALTNTPAGACLPAPYEAHSGFEMFGDIGELCPGCPPVPANLANLQSVSTRFEEVIDASVDALESQVRVWIGER